MSLLKLLSLPLLLSAASASAISITPPPGSGLLPDDGSEIYCTCDTDPNPNIARHVMTVREGFDAFSATTPHEWGFYFADDPETLIPIFTAAEVPVDGFNPSAQVDFDAGTVRDLDSLEIEYAFTPRLGKIGFYIRVEVGREPILSYSQASLNGGTDTFGSFQAASNDLLRVVAFEIDGRVLSLETVYGVCNVVPEPSVAVLLGGGLVALAARRRR